MTQERPLPRRPMSLAVLILLPFVALAGLATWLAMRYDSEVVLFVLFLSPVILGYLYYYHRRCPECHSRLAVRRDYIGGAQRYRMLLDCARCGIAWDTGHIGDESSSGD
jgi:predicted Zn finger-like uncharacterized protein